MKSALSGSILKSFSLKSKALQIGKKVESEDKKGGGEEDIYIYIQSMVP
jgi:hypothetical protein